MFDLLPRVFTTLHLSSGQREREREAEGPRGLRGPREGLSGSMVLKHFGFECVDLDTCYLISEEKHEKTSEEEFSKARGPSAPPQEAPP